MDGLMSIVAGLSVGIGIMLGLAVYIARFESISARKRRVSHVSLNAVRDSYSDDGVHGDVVIVPRERG